MEQQTALSGNDLRAMLTAGTSWLEKIVPDINALNVYPVPDGDCGTNMLLTMRASLAEAGKLDKSAGADAVAEALARGALMGARGNSGVILSQIWRGLAEGTRDRATLDAGSLATALGEAATVAYQALSKPVEGTILTVVKEAAAAAADAARRAGAGPTSALGAAVRAAREAVKNTPNLLNVLRDAGVVDAGGHGLFTLLQGAWLHLRHDTGHHAPELLSSGIVPAVQNAPAPEEDDSYGFCTQFMLKGEGIDMDGLKGAIEGMGKSLMVVGDGTAVRVHIHALEPQAVLQAAEAFGKPEDIDINDMDEQHIEFLVLHRERTVQLGVAVIAVVNGDGLVSVFSDLGAAAIVPGGQTMNPSTMDLLRTIEEVPSDKILLLPNNKNVLPTALLCPPLTKKTVRVIPTETVPQGIAALIAFLPEADYETNVGEMTEAIGAVRTLEITRATRATKVNGLSIAAGAYIGLVDNELLASGETRDEVAFNLLGLVDTSDAGILTVYYGQAAPAAGAEALGERIRERYPGLEVGVVNGGQPNYDYLISVE
jgi:DAK2 domain fusion protein YloV